MSAHPATLRLAEGRTGEEIAALTARVKAETARLRVLRECPTALSLAAKFVPGTVQTPALRLLNDRIHDTMRTPGGRLVISIPPQEGKSRLAQAAILRRFIANPDGQIGFASYTASLARRSGRTVRGLIETHGAALGIQVARDRRDASDWEIQGHRGGMYSVGVGGSLTGRPISEGLVVDDPIKDEQAAESEAVMGTLHDWWESVALTRLAPGAWVIVIQTRWSEHDLAGRLIGEGWPSVNIPALADGHAPDALDRPVGEWLESVWGRTPADWEQRYKAVGERVFAALYQGMPSPPGGGIFRQEWFDRDRVATRPAGMPPVVVVDPADNTGGGDEAGIIVASTDTAGDRIFLGPDYSGTMTTARWVRVALLAVVRHEAAALAYESSLSGLDRSVRDGWAILRKQARVLHRLGADGEHPDLDVVEAATAELTHPEDPDTTRQTVSTELLELWPLIGGVPSYPAGPAIRVIRAKGSKQHRAQLAAPLYENRRVSHVGRLAKLEHQQAVWQPTQDSPDRLDAAVHAILLLSGAAPASLGRTADRLPTRSTQNRQSRLTRSTRR